MLLLKSQLARISWLAIIFFIALFLRLWGIDNGMPYVQRPDETGDIAQSMRIIQGETPKYAYHRVAWSITQIPLHTTHFLVRAITTQNFSFNNFENAYYTDRASFILATRSYLSMFTSLACVLVALAVYKLTYDKRAGLIGGLFLAIYPSHVYLSKIALPDAFATLWVAVCLLGAIYIADKGNRWAYILAGVGSAIAMLVRLQSLTLVIFPIVCVHILAWWRQPNRSWRFFWTQWLWAVGAFLIAHIIFNPFIILKPINVLDDIQFIFNERYTGTNNWNPESSVFRPSDNFSINLPLPITFLRPYLLVPFLYFTFLSIKKRASVSIVIAISGWLFIFSILPTSIPRITFWLPAVVPIAIGIGWGAKQILDIQNQIYRFLSIALIALVGGFALLETIKIDTVLAASDTQSLAYELITSTIPPDSHIMIGDTFIYTVPIVRNLTSIERLAEQMQLPPFYQFSLATPTLLPKSSYNIFGHEFIPQIQSDEEMLDFVNRHTIEYIVETDYCGGLTPYDWVSSLTFPTLTETIRSQLELLYVVSPFYGETCEQHIENRTHMEYMQLWDWERVGPIIRIYRVQ